MFPFLFAKLDSNEKKLTEKLIRTFENEAIPHIDVLYNYAIKITGSSRNAGKLIKETYAKAFDFWKNFEPGTDCKEWLFRIMRNTFISSFKKKNADSEKITYEEIEKSYEEIKPLTPDNLFLEKGTYNNITDKVLSNFISLLPADLRTVIIRHDIQSYSYDEVADFVDVPFGTVRTRLYRARKMLFTKLYNYVNKKAL